MDIFSTREIALAIWVAVLAVWAVTKGRKSPSFKGDIYNLVKAFLVKPILISLGLMTAYIGLLVYGLREASLWDISQLKSTIIWSVSVAAVSLFRINQIVADPRYFRNAVKDNLKVVVLVEYLIGFWTFDFWIELLIVPFLALVGGMLAIAQSDKKYQSVERLLNGVLTLFGIILIVHAVYKLMTDFDAFARADTLLDFSLPPIMTLLFLPFLFVLSLYVNYQNAFLKLRFAISDPSLRFYAKRRAVIAFHARTELLKRWARNLAISRPAKRQDVEEAIREVKRIRQREEHPEAVPLERGWSPFAAGAFLAAEGLTTGDYHRGAVEYDEWWAESFPLELGDGIIPDNITYRVFGDETAATRLKLRLNVNARETAQDALRKLLDVAKVLYQKALGHQMPEDVAAYVRAGDEFAIRLHGKEVVVSKDVWPGDRTGGNSVTLIIRNTVNRASDSTHTASPGGAER